MTRFFDNKNILNQNRGGDRKKEKNILKFKSVCSFIKSLKARESHYNREKSRRSYLPSDLNITKLSKLYNKSVDKPLQVKNNYFRRFRLFSYKFFRLLLILFLAHLVLMFALHACSMMNT